MFSFSSQAANGEVRFCNETLTQRQDFVIRSEEIKNRNWLPVTLCDEDAVGCI